MLEDTITGKQQRIIHLMVKGGSYTYSERFHTFSEQFRKYIAIKMFPFVCISSSYALYRYRHVKVTALLV